MKRFVSTIVTAAAGLVVLRASPALAHAVCGSRIFPVTLTMDDPGVADEASLPTVSTTRQGADGGPGSVHEYDFNFEYDKRITTNLGVGFNYGWNLIQTDHAKTQTGFQDFVVTPKYSTCVSADHEFIVAAGVQRVFGATGTQHIGSDVFGSTTPTLYVGKGLGDVPLDAVRPFSVTGELSYEIPDRGLKSTFGGLPGDANGGNAREWFGAVSLQYSIPYLQSQVKDYGLPSFFSHLVPLVEITWTSPASAPNNLATTWTIAPGIIYEGQSYQVGIELLVPANKAAGPSVGAIAQLHLYLDDLFPNSIGKPLLDF